MILFAGFIMCMFKSSINEALINAEAEWSVVIAKNTRLTTGNGIKWTDSSQ
jgi:hypothetical protein